MSADTKTVVISGATAGIGLAAAKAYAREGYHVIGIGRSEHKCAESAAQVEAAALGAQARYFVADLSRQADVERVADEISAYLKMENGGKLDVLVNNAGGISAWYTTTPEGYETQFALNHLAGFLLTHRLLPMLLASEGRVILTGSGSHKYMRMHWKDIMYEKRYHVLLAYKQSKLAGMLFAGELNRRFAGRGVRAYVVDPGLVNTGIGSKNSAGITAWFWEKRRKHGTAPEVPAETYVFLAEEMPAPMGLYYHNCREQKYSRQAKNEADAQRLFALSEKLCGITFGQGDET